MFLLKHVGKTKQNSTQIKLAVIKQAEYNILNPDIPIHVSLFFINNTRTSALGIENSSCFTQASKRSTTKTLTTLVAAALGT